jgi:hypothetical protein
MAPPRTPRKARLAGEMPRGVHDSRPLGAEMGSSASSEPLLRPHLSVSGGRVLASPERGNLQAEVASRPLFRREGSRVSCFWAGRQAERLGTSHPSGARQGQAEPTTARLDPSRRLRVCEHDRKQRAPHTCLGQAHSARGRASLGEQASVFALLRVTVPLSPQHTLFNPGPNGPLIFSGQ